MSRKSEIKLAVVLLGAIMWALPGSGAPILTLFNTGVATNDPDTGAPQTLTAAGEADQHYTVIGGIGGSFSPTVTGNLGYPFPTWSADNGLSEWISPQTGYLTFGRDPVGYYTYMTTFDLTGYDARTAAITGQVVADNAVAAVKINGFDTGYSQTTRNFALAPFSIPNGHYNSGVNTLEFLVYNSGNAGGGNPSGLRVQLSGTAAQSDLRDEGYFTMVMYENADEPVPFGTSYATMTVSAKGGVVLAGRLSDGESFSTSGALVTGSASTYFPVNVTLNYPSAVNKNAKGSLVGNLVFTQQAAGDIGDDFQGTLQWQKPQQKGGDYPAAFNETLEAEGSLYTNVPGSGPLPGFPVASGSTDGTLELSDTNDFYISAPAQITTGGQLVLFSPPDKVQVTVNPTTGVFKGTFVYPSRPPRLTAFTGVLIQDETYGEGFFLGPFGSGEVYLSPYDDN